MSAFQDAKMWLVEAVGLAKDAMHVHVGLAVFLLAAALFRLPLRDWRPLAAAVLAALAGEVWDYLNAVELGKAPEWDRHRHDLVNTLFWPLVLFALARWTRVLKR